MLVLHPVPLNVNAVTVTLKKNLKTVDILRNLSIFEKKIIPLTAPATLILPKMPFKLADVQKEYEKNPHLKREDIHTLLDWLKSQPHLPKITELQAILFLHSCHYHLDSAKEALDKYFTLRTQCSDLFTSASEEVIRKTLISGFIKVLPKPTPEGYLVLVMKLMDCRAEHYNCVNHTKLIDMVLTLHLHQHGTNEGLLLLLDMKGCALGHVTRINLSALKQLLHYLQEAAPIRIKGLHYVNVVFFTDKLIALLKPFMKNELIKMMKFHSSTFETLYKYIPRVCLPKDYGGEGPTLQSLLEEHITELVTNLDFFKWHDTLKTDETKRLKRPQETISSVQGICNKLEID